MSTKTMPLGNYSHIYVQEGAEAYPLTQAILQQFPQSTKIPLPDYKGVFNRPGQNFQVQKESPKLILGIKKDGFLYQAKERINSFGQDVGEVYYNSHIRNCLYNCDYCFLQGMHNSGHTLVFVNTQDFFPPVKERLREGKVYLSLSYLTDILAYEHFIPIVQEWLAWSKGHPGLELEVRTKGEDLGPLRHLEAQGNLNLVWSLTPADLARKYEKGTAGLAGRLMGVKAALDMGWRVSLCLDPILYTPDWEEQYTGLLEKMARSLPLDQIHALSLGGFRLAQDFLENIRRMRQDVDILYFPFQEGGGEVRYPQELLTKMKAFFDPWWRRLGLANRVSYVGHWGSPETLKKSSG
jgi:spore photoproduct lyase